MQFTRSIWNLTNELREMGVKAELRETSEGILVCKTDNEADRLIAMSEVRKRKLPLARTEE